MSRFNLCDCPAGFSAAPERHAPDCPGRFGSGKPPVSTTQGVAVRDKAHEHFEVWYLGTMVDLLGKSVRDQAQKNLAWTRDDGSYVDPALRLALMAWQASRIPAWQPIDTCPEHKDVLFFRTDAGVFAGMITDADHFMSDKERDEWEGTEEEMFELDVFGYGDFGVCRCDGSERPTHWMPLPAEPEVKP